MPWAVSVPRKKLILSPARGKWRGSNDSSWRKNFVSKKASQSAARPCAASCGLRNGRLCRSAGRANIGPTGRPALATA
jgi:hypothetical protein